MGSMGEKPREDEDPKEIHWDLTACCDEAQADGVPCTELDRDCEICDRARPVPRDPRDRCPTEPGEDGPAPVSGA